jgi:hypothetical protein
MADQTIPEGEPRDGVRPPRADVDRARLRRILARPVDDELPEQLDAAEGPVDDPWPAA